MKSSAHPARDSSAPAPPGEADPDPITGVLPETLAIVEPLVTWLIRSGIGHAQFAAALKPLFLEQARRELERKQVSATDSAISLLSGLHRKDVRAARERAAEAAQGLDEDRAQWGRPSLASQVLTRWFALPGSPEQLALAGPAPSFEALCRSVSSDVRPRVILQELERLGLVCIDDPWVRRLREAFTPDHSQVEARELFAGAASDHLQAGVHNLSGEPGSFLDQSVFADGLSAESVAELNRLANSLWALVRDRVIETAVPLCEADKDIAHPRRFRLGLYSFHAPEAGAPEPDQ